MLQAMAAKKKPVARKPVFTRDEMSTGKGSKLIRHAAAVISSPPTGAYPVLKVDPAPTTKDPVRDEIRYRERAATAAIAGPVLAKQKAAPADTFARQKMREAEANLPSWDDEDFDDSGDDPVPAAQAEDWDPDKTDPGR